MKKGVRSTKAIVFLIGFLFGMTFFINLNSSRQNSIEELGQEAFHSYLDSTLYGISSGYFQWDAFYDAVENGDYEFVDEQFDVILEEYPFVEHIELIPRESSMEIYEVLYHDDEVHAHFGIFDTNITKTNYDYMTEVHISTEKILNALFEEGKFTIQRVDDDNYLIQLDYAEPLFNIWHIISAVSMGFVGQLAFAYFYRQTIKNHYQIEGLRSIVHLLSKKDSYTADHSEEVAMLALQLGRKLDFPRMYLSQLYSAGLLHDIGKVGIEDRIINKPGSLTDKEMEKMRQHSRLGYEIVKEFPGLEEIANIVLHHHEFLDGTGYPDGLTHREIPTLSQILTVVDVYSAMTSDRPYRKLKSVEETFRTMREMPINQEAVDALEEMIKENT